MAEFTGERVVPGLVDADLWNEHYSRYLFAARLCRGKKVIDLGCGTGYGSAELAQLAQHVTGVDCASEAIAQARAEFQRPNLQYEVARLEELPFADESFQLAVCFEVIEHLEDYRALLKEARRVLAPSGQLIISTPNVEYYAESRKLNGPNPFHVHEFSYEEFRDVLSEFFPNQTFFVQNHSSGVVFLPLEASAGSELRLEQNKPNPAEAHFFVAVCAARPLLGAPAFIYLPTTANVLREREHHIARLEGELVTKNEWLTKAQAEHQQLVEQYRGLKQEVEAKNQWALQQNQALEEAAGHIARLEGELATTQRESATVIAGLEADLAKQVAWGEEQEGRLNAHIQTLDARIAEAAKQLTAYQAKVDELEKTVVERTVWAQTEQSQREAAEAKLSSVEASRWIRMGKAFGLGPKF